MEENLGTREKILEAYEPWMTLIEIAREAGCCHKIAQHHLEHLGLPYRDGRREKVRRRLLHQFGEKPHWDKTILAR